MYENLGCRSLIINPSSRPWTQAALNPPHKTFNHRTQIAPGMLRSFVHYWCMHAIVGTRVVIIAFSVSTLSRFCFFLFFFGQTQLLHTSRPPKRILQNATFFLGVLSLPTSLSGLQLIRTGLEILLSRRSTSGYLFNIGSGGLSLNANLYCGTFFLRGRILIWLKLKQTKEAIWFRSLSCELLNN